MLNKIAPSGNWDATVIASKTRQFYFSIFRKGLKCLYRRLLTVIVA